MEFNEVKTKEIIEALEKGARKVVLEEYIPKSTDIIRWHLVLTIDNDGKNLKMGKPWLAV